MSTAIISRMPTGFAGSITRANSKTVQQEANDGTTPPTTFGGVVKLVSGLLQPIASGDDNTKPYGFLVRPYPTQTTTNALGAATPDVNNKISDVMRRGYMAVTLKLGTAAKGGQVYVVTTAGGSVVVGDIVTSSSPAGGGTGVTVPGAYFEGPAGADGVVEIGYNI